MLEDQGLLMCNLSWQVTHLVMVLQFSALFLWCIYVGFKTKVKNLCDVIKYQEQLIDQLKSRTQRYVRVCTVVICVNHGSCIIYIFVKYLVDAVGT